MSDNPAPGKPALGIESPQPELGTLSTQPDPGLTDPAQNKLFQDTRIQMIQSTTLQVKEQELHLVKNFMKVKCMTFMKMEDPLASVDRND
jgi:hypothetical protein